MNNPHQYNYTQQLEHRLRMVEDDLHILKKFIFDNNLANVFDKSTSTCDSAWSNIVNIEVACDLKDDTSLGWGMFL
jgi:hypothetical protein